MTTLDDSLEYNGEWHNDMKHGKGTLVYAESPSTKMIYEGDWVKDRKEGSGRMQYSNHDEYFGQWKNDKRHGKGRFASVRARDKADNTNVKSLVYLGDWVEDRKEGSGEITYPNGDRFVGTFLGDGPLDGTFTKAEEAVGSSGPKERRFAVAFRSTNSNSSSSGGSLRELTTISGLSTPPAAAPLGRMQANESSSAAAVAAGEVGAGICFETGCFTPAPFSHWNPTRG